MTACLPHSPALLNSEGEVLEIPLPGERTSRSLRASAGEARRVRGFSGAASDPEFQLPGDAERGYSRMQSARDCRVETQDMHGPLKVSKANLLAYALSWIVMSIFVGKWFIYETSIKVLDTAWAISQSGYRTEAVVTTVRPADALNAKAVGYDYLVAGVNYHGYSDIESSSDVRSGSRISVWVLPTNPSRSAASIPALQSQGRQALSFGLVTEAVMTLAVFGPLLGAWLRTRKQSLPAEPTVAPQQLATAPQNVGLALVLTGVLFSAGLWMAFDTLVRTPREYDAVRERGVVASATVTSYHDDESGKKALHVEYRDEAGQIQFCEATEGSNASTRPGRQVAIRYLRGNKSRCYSDFELGNPDATFAVVFAIVFNGMIGTVFAFLARSYIKHRKDVSG